MKPNAKHTVIIDGETLTAWGLRRWIREHMGYSISWQTLHGRIRRGLSGRDLIAPPQNNRNPNGRPRRHNKVNRRLSDWLQRPPASD